MHRPLFIFASPFPSRKPRVHKTPLPTFLSLCKNQQNIKTETMQFLVCKLSYNGVCRKFVSRGTPEDVKDIAVHKVRIPGHFFGLGHAVSHLYQAGDFELHNVEEEQFARCFDLCDTSFDPVAHFLETVTKPAIRDVEPRQQDGEREKNHRIKEWEKFIETTGCVGCSKCCRRFVLAYSPLLEAVERHFRLFACPQALLQDLLEKENLHVYVQHNLLSGPSEDGELWRVVGTSEVKSNNEINTLLTTAIFAWICESGEAPNTDETFELIERNRYAKMWSAIFTLESLGSIGAELLQDDTSTYGCHTTIYIHKDTPFFEGWEARLLTQLE